GVSGWRFYATLAAGGLALALQFGAPEYGNLAVFPLLLLALVYNNRTTPISVILWVSIILLTWRIVRGTLVS
ncbi:hypothetical protein LCGC14_1520590, partial [marine sediment metagenome]